MQLLQYFDVLVRTIGRVADEDLEAFVMVVGQFDMVIGVAGVNEAFMVLPACAVPLAGELDVSGHVGNEVAETPDEGTAEPFL